MDNSGAPKRFTKARAIYVILLGIFLVVFVFVTRNPSVVKGPMSATEYCKLLYDAPGKIWEAQLPPKIKKIAKEIETNETTDLALNESGKEVAKAIYKIAEAVQETLDQGIKGDLLSALAGIGGLGVAATELGVAEANVIGCDNWTPPATEIPA